MQCVPAAILGSSAQSGNSADTRLVDRQVVDHRMSMISQGTWQPRPSMASRPGSFHPGASQYSAGDRRSYFADPGANRHSTYSTSGSAVGVPSPLRNGNIRTPPPAEMRQTGHGERASRISFAVEDDHHHYHENHTGRPSFATHRRPGSVQTRSSMYNSQPRNGRSSHEAVRSQPTSASPQPSPELSRSGSSTGSLAAMAQEEGEYFSRSSAREELGSDTGMSPRTFSPRHGHQQSFSSSLRNELGQHDPDPAAPRMPAHAHTASRSSASPSHPSRLRPMLLSLDTNASSATGSTTGSSMPLAFRSSQILSPDEALASYARVTSPSGSAPPGSPFSLPPPSPGAELVPTPTESQARGAAKGGLSGLIGKSKGMLRSWTGSSIASVLQTDRRRGTLTPVGGQGSASPKQAGNVEDEKHGGAEVREGAKSPFEDPVEGEYVYNEKEEEGARAL